MIESLRKHCLTIARLSLPAWVGAATLFVINGILLVTSGAFESDGRDHIALIRFPTYYLFGFGLVGLGLIGLLGSVRFAWKKVAIVLVVFALVLMTVDYVSIYRPLEAMISPPGRPRSPEFERYHRLSEMINTLHVGLCLLAAVLVCRPSVQESPS